MTTTTTTTTSAIASTARSGFDNAWGRVHAGIVTTGKLVVLGIEAAQFAVVDIVRGRFSWSEFLLQAWFMTRVSLLPTILVAIPFGVITSVQIGAVANQIGATSFSGAVNGIGILRQGAPLVTSLMIAGAVGSAICSDLGARTVREEIDALKVMGISPVQRLVAPRCRRRAAGGDAAHRHRRDDRDDHRTVHERRRRVHLARRLPRSPSPASASPPTCSWPSSRPLIFGFIATIVAAHKGLSASGGPKGVADAVEPGRGPERDPAGRRQRRPHPGLRHARSPVDRRRTSR